ncbi:MAG: DUF4394 domain-containing protein [Thermoleophilia bacterium]
MRRALAALAALGAALLPGTALAAPAVGLLQGSQQALVLFDTSSPGALATVPLTGVPTGFDPVAIDVRPATGGLYLLAVDGGGVNDTGQLLLVDPGTGAATPVGGAFTISPGIGSGYGMDTSPVTDTIRIVSSVQANMRLNPTTGAVVATDTSLSVPQVTHVAYDRSVAGASATTLFGIDTNSPLRLVRIGGPDGSPSPDGGVVSNVGALGTPLGASGGFDIAPDGTAYLTSNGFLGKVDLATGVFTLTDQIGILLDGLAILQPVTLGVGAANVAATESDGVARVTVTRSGPATGTVRVAYATSPGTATANVDFVPTAGTLTFGPGVTSQTILVGLLGDDIADAGETFTVTLSSPSIGATLGPSSSVVSLADPVATAPVDATPPVGLVLVDRRVARTRLERGLAVQVGCTERCSVRLSLRLGRKAIASSTGSLKSPGFKTLRLKPGKAGRAAVGTALGRRGVRSVALSLQATVVDPAGNASTTSRTVTVRRA